MKVHVYWDQGGMFGQSRCLISHKPRRRKQTYGNHQIETYYMGHMDWSFILEVLAMFDKQYNCTTIISTEAK